MTDALRGILGAGAGAPLAALALAVDALGRGTEFTGAQLEALGELQQRLADILRQAQGMSGGGDESG